MTNFNEKQIALIKEEIDETLRQRCINVETVLTIEEKRGQKKFILSSTKFNTVPVLHSAIEINNFGGSITQDGSNADCTRFYIPVHAAYEGNGISLFNIIGIISEKNPDHVFFEADRGHSRSSF